MVNIQPHHLNIVLILTVGFAFASFLGYLTHRMKLSPLLGYLLAGYLIGPFSPGFVADTKLAEQLAEIGVILMMFGVGLHFKWEDLLNVRNIAVPGAVGQTLIATTLGMVVVYSAGWPLTAGVIMGLAIGVASTVVLVRVLSDNNLLRTPQGHIAVGWLIVEDVFTVIALILLPSLASNGMSDLLGMAKSLVVTAISFSFLILFLFTVGRRITSFILFTVARTRSHELFTLTVLALTFVIATGSTLLIGTSIALGAFLAGMIIGQSDVKHQATANSLPIKDAFLVIFFLSVGMLFNPIAIVHHFWLFLGVLAIILFFKPLAAFLIVTAKHYPIKTALTVSLALAQIGEFSFILAEEAMKLHLLADEGFDILVACAFISISLNPLLFKYLEPIYSILEKKLGVTPPSQTVKGISNLKKGIIIGFGPIGRSVFHTLEKLAIDPIVIDRNVDTISQLKATNKQAVFGDASQVDILESAQIKAASLLVITVPEIEAACGIIHAARQLKRDIKIIARLQYSMNHPMLEELRVHNIICDEEEAIKAFTIALEKEVHI